MSYHQGEDLMQAVGVTIKSASIIQESFRVRLAVRVKTHYMLYE